MTVTAPALTETPLRAIWAEITGMCQLSCSHCYAGSGPEGTHGTMTPQDWETALTQAAGLGTRHVCFIGGEPTLSPALPRLVRHALSTGMRAEVFSNLVHVTPELWELFETPGVSLATSWYTSDRDEHRQITGRDTFRQTLSNITEASRRQIQLRVGMVTGIIPGQHAAEGEEMLRRRGIASIGTDHLRQFGRGTKPDPAQACGHCGHHRAAILPDGTVTPCPLTRWMHAGNVTSTPLADIVGAVTQIAATLPARAERCDPTCQPELHEPCDPFPCMPSRDARSAVDPCDPACQPTCVPDSYCNPLCGPGACKPRI
jgi:MoaA/NifB/PqqE/SkfB family radical SAM enzyme